MNRAKTTMGAGIMMLTAASWAPGCGGSGAPGEPGEETGAAEIDLATTPADARCLRLTVAGSRTITRSFDLAPEQPAVLSVDRLPTGLSKVDAVAFAQACAAVASAAVPRWVTDLAPLVRIDPVEIAKIDLKLIRNGRGSIGIDFEAPPWFSDKKSPIDIAVIGDSPYGAAQIEDFPGLVVHINSDPTVSEVLHVGDIKNGSSRCDDSYFQTIAGYFSAFQDPLVYTPGDNEWTDCHRANNGAYDPLERLVAVRKTFYPTPGLALGGGFKQVLSQASFAGRETFVENQLWFEASVAFAAIHVVGSNDSTPPWYTDDTTGTKADDPARRDAERTARNAAALEWLDRVFEIARGQSAAGVVIMMQADMWAGGAADGFNATVQRIADRARAFAKPVLLLEGDSHVYLTDAPLAAGSPRHGVITAAPNVTRVVVEGSTTSEWLKLHVDPGTPAVFTWQRVKR